MQILSDCVRVDRHKGELTIFTKRDEEPATFTGVRQETGARQKTANKMKSTTENLYCTSITHNMRRIGRIICMVMFTMYCASSDGAVVQRTNTYTTTTTTTGGTVSAANRPTTAARTNFVSTAPVIVSSADSNQGDDTSEPENPEPIEEETEDQIIIENKTSQFDIVLNSYGASTGEDTSSSELEALIRQQRAALDTQDSLNLTTNYFQQGNNTCDLDLRKCMQTNVVTILQIAVETQIHHGGTRWILADGIQNAQAKNSVLLRPR